MFLNTFLDSFYGLYVYLWKFIVSMENKKKPYPGYIYGCSSVRKQFNMKFPLSFHMLISIVLCKKNTILSNSLIIFYFK